MEAAPATDRGRDAPALALVAGGICSVQFASALAATLFSRIGSSGTGLLRLASAAIVLLVLWRPRPRSYDRRRLALAATFGLALAGMNLSFYAALARIPLGIAVTIEFVGPLTVAVLGSRRRLDLLWVALAVGGILALTRGGGGISAVGIGFALLAGCFWAAYILINSRIGREFQGGRGLALAMSVAAVVALPLGIASGGSQLLTAHALLLGAAVGMLGSAIPYSLEVEALRRLQANVFAVLMSLEPAVAALAGLIVLGQSLGARALIGIGLVIIASAGASRGTRRVPVEV